MASQPGQASGAITGSIESTEVFDEVENVGEPAPTVPATGDPDHTDELPLDLSLVTFA